MISECFHFRFNFRSSAAASSSHQQPEAQEPATPQAAAAATPDLPDRSDQLQAATPELPDQPQVAAASSVMSLGASTASESLVLEDGVTESLVHFPDDCSDDSLPQATPATQLPESEPPSATPQLQQVAGGQPQAAGGRRRASP